MAGPGGELLLDLRPAGTAEEIARLFPPPRCFTAFLDGEAARGKAALLDALAAGFRFPAHFGRNWDALLDCLRSLPLSVQAGEYLLAVRNPGALLADAPGELDNFWDIAGEAASFLREAYGAGFRVIYY